MHLYRQLFVFILILGLSLTCWSCTNQKSRAEQIAEYHKTVNIGLEYLQNRDEKQALKLFTRAQKMNPDAFNAYYGFGRYYAAIGETEKEKQMYMKCLSIYTNTEKKKPGYLKHYTAYNRLGWCLAKLNRNNDAVVMFKKALALDPNNLRSLNRIGSAYAALKEYDKAISSLNKSLSIDSDQPETYLALAAIYEEQGNIELANEMRSKI